MNVQNTLFQREPALTSRVCIRLGSIVFAGAYFALNLNSWRTYGTGGDFGLFMQSMNDPTGLLRNSVEGSHFSDHFSPIYDLFAPLVLTTHSILPILALQSIAGALAASGLYELAVLKMPPGVSLPIASLSLIYPPLAAVMFGDPYETCFAPAATIWLILFVLRRNWTHATLVALIALAIKEDQAVFLAWDAALAFAWATRIGDVRLRRFSSAIFFVAIFTLGVFVCWLRPALAADGSWSALHTTLSSASGYPSAAAALGGRLGYLAQMLVPLAFAPLLAPRALLFAVPALAEVLIPANANVTNMSSHYAGSWIGYLLPAWVFGAARLHASNPTSCKRAVAAALGLCAIILIFDSPTHWRVNVHSRTSHDARLDKLIADELPSTETIGMGDAIYGHLWEQSRFERGMERSPCFALIDTTVTDAALQNTMEEQIRDRLYGAYAPQWTKGGVVLYRRSTC